MSRVLVVVHPGSCCGSATALLGSSLASACRKDLVQELDEWTGDLLVMDGFLSDELPDYPALDQAIKRALDRAPNALRVFACDNEGEHFTALLPHFIRDSPWAGDTQTRFCLTGALRPQR